MADFNSAFTGAQIDAAIGAAQTATQPGDLATVATTGDYDDLANLPTLGTAAAANTGDFAAASHTHALSDLTQSGATDGQVVTWDNALGQWVAETPTGGGGATDYVRTRAGTVQDLFDMADTWNDAATTFNGIRLNVTDTASAAASNLINLQVGGVSQFSVSKAGIGTIQGALNMRAGGTSNDTLFFRNSAGNQLRAGIGIGVTLYNSIGGFGISPDLGAADTILNRDAAGTFAQRNGTNPQALNLYNTFTNVTNYERARMGWAGNAFQIRPEADGTGTTRVLHISGLPTSNPGPGILWNDSGTVVVGT
jgi:hypothetical protein